MTTRLASSGLAAVFITTFFLQTVAYQSRTLHRGSNVIHANFVRHASKHLNASVLAVTKEKDPIWCSFSCLKYAGCYSYNLGTSPDARGEFACHLLPTDRYNASESLASSKVFDHYSIKSPCESSPCENGGACRAVYETGRYKCDCRSAFFGRHCQYAKLNSCQALKQAYPSLPDGLYKLNDTSNPGNDYPAYCDMTSFGGGWTMCYTTGSLADPKDETTYNETLPYGTNGYRTNCNNIEFTEIMFFDEESQQKESFTRRSGGKMKVIESYSISAQPQGLWDSHGLADSSYSYQLLVCDHSFYSGFHVSGYTNNCYKQCGSWCGDTVSPYFRTSATDSRYFGVAFNVNGHAPNIPPNKLVSVGLR